MFKLTDCPRNVGDSATLSDKEDLISTFVQEKTKQNNATSILLPFSARKHKTKTKEKHLMFVRFSFTAHVRLASHLMLKNIFQKMKGGWWGIAD